MGMFNCFVETVECPYCCHIFEAAFQDYLGHLMLNDYRVGDCLYLYSERPKHYWSKGGAVIPLNISVCPDKTFWTVGLDNCPICKEDICAIITIDNETIKSIKAINCKSVSIYDCGCGERK